MYNFSKSNKLDLCKTVKVFKKRSDEVTSQNDHFVYLFLYFNFNQMLHGALDKRGRFTE